ncbi:unnamed protein product [Fraxinus pennsylvanica]|uniref:Uncharacterized protein n=1 Tax=Fraxinus pennsylvanica TaxID=56036 RepID=A0AAD1YS09_9LAMI|nr:unnamed protein product [Fraxinus pennsylvanica]
MSNLGPYLPLFSIVVWRDGIGMQERSLSDQNPGTTTPHRWRRIRVEAERESRGGGCEMRIEMEAGGEQTRRLRTNVLNFLDWAGTLGLCRCCYVIRTVSGLNLEACNIQNPEDIEKPVIAVNAVQQENYRNLYNTSLLVSPEEMEENQITFFKKLDNELNKSKYLLQGQGRGSSEGSSFAQYTNGCFDCITDQGAESRFSWI